MRQNVVGIVLTLLAVPFSAAAQPRELVPAPLRATQAVVLAAYPELREQALTWRLVPTVDGHVVEARPAVSPGTESAATAALVRADVTLRNDGALETARFGGTLIDAVRQRTLSRTPTRGGDPAPELTPRLAPSDPTAPGRVVSDDVRHALGMTAVATTEYRSAAPVDAPADAQTWHVALEDGSGGGLTLIIEPIEGRLLSVVRR